MQNDSTKSFLKYFSAQAVNHDFRNQFLKREETNRSIKSESGESEDDEESIDGVNSSSSSDGKIKKRKTLKD